MTAESDVEAVVLVGGRGIRLRPLTLSAAKPMLPTAGVPFLAHQLSRLRAVDIRRVVLGTSYRASTFSDHSGGGSALGMDIAYVVEDAPLGTGGAIRNVLDRLTAPTILLLNGDILSGVDLQALPDQHRSRQADVTLHLVRVPDARAFGCVLTDPDGWVSSAVESPTLRRPIRSTPAATSSGATSCGRSRPAPSCRSNGRLFRGLRPPGVRPRRHHILARSGNTGVCARAAPTWPGDWPRRRRYPVRSATRCGWRVQWSQSGRR